MQSGETLEERVAYRFADAYRRLHATWGSRRRLPSSAQELEHLELIALSERRVLMIVATRDRMVRNSVVTLERAMTQDDLIQLRNYVNANFAGWTLEKARAELLRRIEEERAMYDAVLQQLTLLCQKGLLTGRSGPATGDGWRLVSGGPRSASDARNGCGIFSARWKRKSTWWRCWTGFSMPRRARSGSTSVWRTRIPAMSDLTLIGVTIDLPSGVRTRIAVLGPMRMQYEKVVSTRPPDRPDFRDSAIVTFPRSRRCQT